MSIVRDADENIKARPLISNKKTATNTANLFKLKENSINLLYGSSLSFFSISFE